MVSRKGLTKLRGSEVTLRGKTIIGYMLGLYGDNGKENGNYYDGVYIGVIWVVVKIMVSFWVPHILGAVF